MRKMADKDAAAGQSVVVITHDVESKLIDQCDRLIVLAPGGRMAYFGPPAEGLKYFGKRATGRTSSRRSPTSPSATSPPSSGSRPSS